MATALKKVKMCSVHGCNKPAGDTPNGSDRCNRYCESHCEEAFENGEPMEPSKSIKDDVAQVIIDSIGDTITIEQAIGLLASKCRIKLIGGAWFALSDGQTFTYELSFERF